MRVDDGFSVWDSARNSSIFKDEPVYTLFDLSYDFSLDTLWNGLKVEDRLLCNGLIADWVKWQYQPEQSETSPFQLLKRVIEHLSPDPHEWMRPGKPTRISINDVRDIPTIDLPYGNVTVTDISAGMKRILSTVTLSQILWAKQGDAINWLTSETFGLKQARSREAEVAIEAAEALMRGETMSAYPPNLRTQKQIDKALRELLPGHDPFWPRWLVEMDLLPQS